MFKIEPVPVLYEDVLEGIELPDTTNFFDDMGQSEISQIFVSEDANAIRCIRFQYVQNGSLVLSKEHGVCDGSNFHSIQFDYPSEFLIKVSGKYTYDSVRSIVFTTNKGIYGPYGWKDARKPNMVEPDMKDFSFDMGKNRQFGGFHGAWYEYGLMSIGVYIKPNNSSAKTISEDKGEDKLIMGCNSIDMYLSSSEELD